MNEDDSQHSTETGVEYSGVPEGGIKVSRG